METQIEVKTVPTMSYEESVQWVRSQPNLEHLVHMHYLDADNFVAAQRFAASEEFQEVAKLLRLRSSSKKIMDLGCGNGIASYAFANMGHEVYGVDPDESNDVGLLAAARLSEYITRGSIVTCRSYAESLPYEDATFDIVYARQAMHHFSNLGKAVSECRRVLKPGGLFLGTREHVVNDEEQLQSFLFHHPLHKLHGGENAHSLTQYVAALEQAGFRVLQALGCQDTAINMDPGYKALNKEKLIKILYEKIGIVGPLLFKIRPFETMYRSRKSAQCKMPGRLYSFLCIAKK